MSDSKIIPFPKKCKDHPLPPPPPMDPEVKRLLDEANGHIAEARRMNAEAKAEIAQYVAGLEKRRNRRHRSQVFWIYVLVIGIVLAWVF